MDQVAKYIVNKTFQKIVYEAHWDVDMELIDAIARPAVNRVIESFYTDSPRGLVLIGPRGCGKSAILALIFKALLEKKAANHPTKYEWQGTKWQPGEEEYSEQRLTDSLFASCPYLGGVDYERKGWLEHQGQFLWTNQHQLILRLRQVFNYKSADEIDQTTALPEELLQEYVFLDEFGKSYDDREGANRSLQENYFDWLWGNRKCLVLSTNMTMEELEGWRDYKYIVDRILDPAWVDIVNFGDVKSKRTSKFQQHATVESQPQAQPATHLRNRAYTRRNHKI